MPSAVHLCELRSVGSQHPLLSVSCTIHFYLPHHRFLMVIFNCFCKLWEDYNSVFFIRQPTILIYILIIFNTKLSKLLYYSFLYSYMASSFLIDSSTISFVILYGLWSISFISTAIFAISSSCELSNSEVF